MQPLGQTSQARIDSVITASRKSLDELSVVYAFNNPCGDAVEAFTRTTGTAIEVRFDVTARNPADAKSDEPRACPAALVFEAYGVRVRVPRGSVVVRGYLGGTKYSRMVREFQFPTQ